MDEIDDILGLEVCRVLKGKAQELAQYSREYLFKELELMDEVEQRVHQVETTIRLIMTETDEINLLRTMPTLGIILAVVIATEIGDINRFSGPEKLTSCAGTVPRVKASGGKVFHGLIRPDVNRYLKMGFY